LLQTLKELNGRVKIDETGIDFQNIRGLLVGFPANFSRPLALFAEAAIAF